MSKFDGIASANWFKNVAKSLGYTASSIGEDLAPTIMDTFKTNFDSAKELSNELKAHKSASDALSKFVKGKTDEYRDKLSTMKSNVKSDIKSGNLYNKERVDKVSGFDFGDDDFDFDFNDNFNDENFDESMNIDISNNYGTDPEVAAEVIDAVQSQSQVIIETANRSAEQNIALSKLQIQSDREIANVLYGGMGTINENLSRLVDFTNSQSSAYISASLKYYEDSIRSFNEILTEIKKITSPEKKDEYGSSRSKFDSVLGFDGGLDLKGYLGSVAKNIKGNYLVSMVSNMLGKGDDEFGFGNPLDEIVANPIGSAMTIVTKSLIPNIIKKSVESLDKSFKSFIPSLLSKIYDNGIKGPSFLEELGFDLGEIFGIKNYAQTKIDTKYYNKGVTPFDGVTKKAIVEVIPTYLSKIYSAVSGRDEVLYDYDNGKFGSKKDLIEKKREEEKYRVIYSYDALSDIKQGISDLGYNYEQSRSIGDDIENFLLEMTKRGERFNPRKQTDSEGNATDVISRLFKSSDPNINFTAEYLRKVILSLPKSSQLSITADQEHAKQSISEYYKEKERSGDDTVLNAMFNGAFDEKFSTKGKGSIFSPTDKFGKSALDYLRDINRILLDKVPVYKVEKDKDRYNKMKSFNDSPLVEETVLAEQGAKKAEGSGNSLRDEISNKLVLENDQKGIRMTDEELEKEIDRRVRFETDKRKFTESKYGPVYDTVGKLLKKINLGPFQENFEKGIDNVAAKIQSVFDKAEGFMYRTIFGGDPETNENGEKQSFFNRMSEALRKPFKEFFGDIKEKLVGPDGKSGLLKEISESDTITWLKDKASKGWEWLLGAKDEEGNREGGLLSDVSNEFKSFGRKIKLYFTGVVKDKDGNIIEESKDGESVFSNIKQMGRDFKNNIKSWLFGDKEKDTRSGKEKFDGVFSGIGSMLTSGISNFSAALFGTIKDADGKNIPKLNGDEILNKIKERAPKSIAGGIVGLGVGGLMSAGGLGVLGSLFLGPMSGLVIGMGGSFLSQSEKFKDWIFGKRDEETNERVGGIISKSTQEFFSKHKAGLIGGTAFGALKGILGFGILPSFVLGGPITGALTGLASSLIFRSESFQKLLFGDEENNREGIFNKIKGNFQGKDFKEKAGIILTGALGGAGLGAILSSFGTLGAIAFGPLSGAIAGVGAGIVLSGDKWRKKIFGDPDDDSKNGLINNLVDGVTKNVLMPAKIQLTEWKFKVQEWFDESIVEPVIDSLAPIREEFSRIGDRIHVFFEDTLEKLGVKKAFDGIKESIRETFSGVGEKVSEYTKKIIEGISKPLGKIAAAPFKLVNLVAEKILLPKHMKEGIASVRKMLIENIKSSDFYKKAIEPITTRVHSAIDTIRDFTKGAISGTFEFMKNVTKKTFGFIGKTIFDVVSAPFKAIGGTLTGITKSVAGISGFISKGRTGKSDQSIIENITTGNGQNGFASSLGSLINTFIPFTATRKAAQYANIDIDSIKERVRNKLNSEGKTVSDDEFNKLVDKEARRTPGGASYRNDQLTKREQRAEERKKKKEEHAAIIKKLKGAGSISEMNSILDSYNGTDKGKLQEEAGKIADKVLKTKYGKDFSSKSNLEKDQFKTEIETKDASVKTAENTKTIVDYIKDVSINGIKIRANENVDNKSKSNKDDQKKARFKVREKLINSEESRREDAENNTIGNTAAEQIEAESKDIINENKSILKSLGIETEESRREDAEHSTIGYTATEQRLDRAAEDEAERKQSLGEKILNKLSGIKDATESHAFEWGKIFSKSGLITGAILLALPLISKLFNWLKDNLNFGSVGSAIAGAIKEFLGFTDEDGDRTNSAGEIQTNDDAIESMARGGAYAAQLGKKGFDFAKSTYNTAKTNFSKAKKTITNGYDNTKKFINKLRGNTTDDVVEAAVKNSDEVIDSTAKSTKTAEKFIANTTDDVGKAASKGADDVAEAAIKSADDGIITKFIDMLKTAISKVKEFIDKKLGNISGKLSGVFKHVDDICKGTVLGKFVSKIAKGLGAIATSAATLLTSDVAWATFGAVTGVSKTETANLFHVPQDRVDGLMRTISGVFKAIVNVSWFFVIDLANDIILSVFGIDFLHLLAASIYKILADDKMDANFDEAIKDFSDSYDAYTISQQIAKDNVEYDENGNIALNADGSVKYKDASLIESMDSYNDRENKTALAQAGDKTKAWFGKTFGQKGNEEKYNDALKREEALNKAHEQGLIDDKAYEATMASIQEDKDKYKKIDTFFTKSIGNIKNFGSAIGDYMKIDKGVSVFSSEYWTPPAAEGEDSTVTSTWDKIAFYTGRVLMMGPQGIKNIISKVTDGVTKLIGNVKNFGGAVGDHMQVEDGLSVFSSEYWTYSGGDEDDSVTGTWDKIAFYVGRILMIGPQGIKSVIKSVSDKVTNIKSKLEPIFGFIKQNTQDSITDILNGDTIFTKAYWEPPTAGAEQEELELIPKILFFGQRILTAPAALILSIGKMAFDGIKKIVGNVSNFGSAVGSYMQVDDGVSIFSSNYWTPPTDEDGSVVSGWNKIAFYAGRVLMLAPQGIKNVFSSVSEGVSKVIGNVSNFGSAVGGHMQIDDGVGVFSSEYWTYSGGEEGESSVTGIWDKIAFYTGRVLMMGPQGIKNVFRSVSDGVSKVIGNVSNFGSAIGDHMQIDDGVSVFSSDYWTYSGAEEEGESSVTGTWDKIAFYTGRVLMVGPQGIKNIISKASDGVKTLIGNVTNIADTIKEYANVESIDSNYFVYPEGEEDNSILSGVKRVAFYLTRGIMVVPLGIKSIFNWVGEKVTAVKDWFTGIIDKIKDGLGFDQLEEGSFNYGGGNIAGYPRRTGPVSIDNVTEGIYPGGIGGSSGYDMLKQYGRQTAGYPSYSNKQPHYGVDRSTGKNTSVPSFTEGTVTEVVNRYSPNTGKLSKGHQGGFGNYVKVRDSSGGTNIYAHLNRVNVTKGTKVKTGDKLGIEGNTGNSSGTHLHYETWAGSTRNSVIDPYTYLKRRKKNNIGGGNIDGYPDIRRPYSMDNITEGIYPGGIGGDEATGTTEEENGFSKVFEGIMKILTFPVDAIKKLGTTVFDKITSFIGNVADFAGSVKESMQIDSKLSVFSKDYWTYSGGESESADETATSTMGKIAFYAGRVLMAGPQAIKNIVSKAFEGVKKIIGKVTSAGSTLLNSMQTQDGVSVFSSAYWTPPVNDDGSALGGLNTAAFYVGRVLTVGPQTIRNIISKAFDGISNLIGNVSNFASAVGDGMETDKGVSVFSKEYWTAPEDDGSALSGISRTAFYVGRILKIGPQAITNIISKATSAIGSLLGGVTDIGMTALGYANAEQIDSNYFKFPEADDDGSIFGGIKRVAFYIVRAVTIIPNAIKTLIGSVTEKVTDTVDTIKEKAADMPIIGDIMGLLGIGGGNTAGYPKNVGPVSIDNVTEGIHPGGIGGTIADKVRDAVNMGDRLSKPGYELFNNEWKQYTTSPFGKRTIGGSTSTHYGHDIDKADNAPVPSFTNGTVETVINSYAPDTGFYGSKDGSGYGNYVMVRDSNKNRIYYAHLNKVNVKQGDKVQVGDIIGLQGHTGNSTANHLHLETRVGEGDRKVVAVDPVEYLKYGNAAQTKSSNPNNFSSGTEAVQYSPTLGTVFEPLTNSITQITDKMYAPLNTITENISTQFAPILGSTGAAMTSSSGSTISGSNATISNGARIGDSVKQFESGNNGSSTIGYVSGDIGGRSFGTYQFATFGKSVITDKSNGLYRFWNRYYADQYPGVQPGDNPAFINAWKDAVAKNPEQFAANEWEEIARNFYVPIVNKNKEVLNPDKHSRAAQDILWSTAVQYGPSTSVIRKALAGKNPANMSASQLINTISDYKANTVATYFSGAGQNVRNSVRNRFDNKERKVLLGLGEQGPIPYTIDGVKYGTGGDDSIWTSGVFGIGGDSEPSSFTYSTSDINKFNTNNKVPDSATQSINELKESINDIKSSNNNSGDISEKVTNFLDKILNVLSEISNNTKNTSDNVDKLNTTTERVKSTPPAQVNVNNNSNNAMYDVANKRREEKKNRNYSDAKLIASGAH